MPRDQINSHERSKKASILLSFKVSGLASFGERNAAVTRSKNDEYTPVDLLIMPLSREHFWRR